MASEFSGKDRNYSGDKQGISDACAMTDLMRPVSLHPASGDSGRDSTRIALTAFIRLSSRQNLVNSSAIHINDLEAEIVPFYRLPLGRNALEEDHHKSSCIGVCPAFFVWQR